MHSDGQPLLADEIEDADQTLDLWTGLITSSWTLRVPSAHSRFRYTVVTSSAGLVGGVDGEPNKVDGLSIRVHVQLLVDRGSAQEAARDSAAGATRSQTAGPPPLALQLAFPFPTTGGLSTGANWSRSNDPDHETTDVPHAVPNTARFYRRAHFDAYMVTCQYANVTVNRTPAGTGGASRKPRSNSSSSPHVRWFTPNAHATSFQIVCTFDGNASSSHLNQRGPADGTMNARSAERRSIESWARFWTTGAALDLSKVPGADSKELERRVVLSRYLMRAMDAGPRPPQETGLVYNSWYSKHNQEMRYWHHAHWALWGRPDLIAESDGWYHSALQNATSYAAWQGFDGARWPKAVGKTTPELSDTLPSTKAAGAQRGNAFYWDWPVDIGLMLVWEQPHPILMSELQRRGCAAGQPTGCNVTQLVGKLFSLVEASAKFMASYTHLESDGAYHLGSPTACSEEGGEGLGGGGPEGAPNHVKDGTFELAYWQYGLRLANEWRVHAGLPVNSTWATIANNMQAPNVVVDPASGSAVYNFHAGCTNPYDPSVASSPPAPTQWKQWCPVLQSHPSMVAALGCVPPPLQRPQPGSLSTATITKEHVQPLPDAVAKLLINATIMNATLATILARWDWSVAMGTDYAQLAMTAMRLSRADIVPDILLWQRDNVTAANVYQSNGWNNFASMFPYFPANGGLLLAMAMAVGGWDGSGAQTAGVSRSRNKVAVYTPRVVLRMRVV